MKTHKDSPVDLGRRAADRFIPKSIKTATREQLVDYCAVMYARGLRNGVKRRTRK